MGNDDAAVAVVALVRERVLASMVVARIRGVIVSVSLSLLRFGGVVHAQLGGEVVDGMRTDVLLVCEV